jgi:POT family proton-dependent oligopeptide transporter
MNTSVEATGTNSGSAGDRAFFGHPRGLSTLFFTEMWERFSYYGMRALLTLYMTKTLAEGGLAFDEKYASLIYATYVAAVWYLPLIGGWLADKFLGAWRAVLIGGIVIACGHFSMAFDTLPNFYGGLVLIACGTGLLKPNISAMVGQLYGEGDKRRDAGFSIFYMGINLGAFIAPLVCGYLGQKVNWHYGFAAAGVGMTLGLVQYVIGASHLHHVGRKLLRTHDAEQNHAKGFDFLTAILAVVGALAGAAFGYRYGGGGVVTVPFWCVVGYFAGYLTGTTRLLAGDELMRVLVIFILVLFSIIFWMTFEQAGSSLTLFADRLTRTSIFGWSFPSSWFQSVQPIFIITFAPVFAFIWQRLAARQPSSATKFVFALLLGGVAFVIIAFASTLTGAGRVSPMWLVTVYFLQTLGELCLSPVGLSTITKLSPARMVGVMMGVWFLSISIGSYIAGRTTQLFQGSTPGQLARAFAIFAVISIVAALLLIVLTPMIKKMTPRTEAA